MDAQREKSLVQITQEVQIHIYFSVKVFFKSPNFPTCASPSTHRKVEGQRNDISGTVTGFVAVQGSCDWTLPGVTPATEGLTRAPSPVGLEGHHGGCIGLSFNTDRGWQWKCRIPGRRPTPGSQRPESFCGERIKKIVLLLVLNSFPEI